jgi:hypothetical protein
MPRSLRTDHHAAPTWHVLRTAAFPRTQFCVWQDVCLDSRAARKPAREEYLAGRFLGPNARLSFARLRRTSASAFEKTTLAAKMYYRCEYRVLSLHEGCTAMSPWTSSRRVSLRRRHASGAETTHAEPGHGAERICRPNRLRDRNCGYHRQGALCRALRGCASAQQREELPCRES